MSKIEVNQISSQCGSTLTIGQSGDTIQLACGATQTGFGRTGTVNWDTTAKTASFTAVSGNGYFINTTSAAITLTLPASPSAGDIVAFKDYAFTFATNNLTVDGNGSPIGGGDGANLPIYNTNGTSKTFIYVDGTKGWLVTNESTDTSQETSNLYVTATGGTIVTCGDYRAHIFTAPGTFCVSCGGNPFGSDTVDYFVVAGGGAAGGAGGGGGGFRVSNSVGCVPAPTMSPLAACVSALPVTTQGYPITVGGGGTGISVGSPVYNSVGIGTPGSNSIFSTITSAGGGAGGMYQSPCSPNINGQSGGSGGGGSYGPTTSIGTGGSGNTPPVSPPQGQNGGQGQHVPGSWANGGSGGGAGGVGQCTTGPGLPGNGGIGSFIADAFIGPTAPTYGTPGPVGSTRYFAGGGSNCNPGASGGSGGGGNLQTNGTTNTGGGGGGGTTPAPSTTANGGSGIVIIRYKYQ